MPYPLSFKHVFLRTVLHIGGAKGVIHLWNCLLYICLYMSFYMLTFISCCICTCICSLNDEREAQLTVHFIATQMRCLYRVHFVAQSLSYLL